VIEHLVKVAELADHEREALLKTSKILD